MTASSPSPEPVLVPLLLGLTVVTGLVDAVSYLALGHVFTANMTGNVVFLGFAAAGGRGLSANPRNTTFPVIFAVNTCPSEYDRERGVPGIRCRRREGVVRAAN